MDVTVGATGATPVAPFSDTITNPISTKGGRFCPTIAEVAPKKFLCLHL